MTSRITLLGNAEGVSGLAFDNATLPNASVPEPAGEPAPAARDAAAALALRSLPAPSELAALVAAAEDYSTHAKAKNTRRAYRSDWAAFVRWASARGFCSLPAAPETVALYLAHLADHGRRVAGIERVLVSIAQAHKAARHSSPRHDAIVQEVRKGIRRKLGTAQQQKAPVMLDALRAMVGALPDSLLGRRDRAVLLLGFAGGFRRSELISLDVADLNFTAEGVEVSIRRSKTDQEGAGRKIGVPYGSNPQTCPCRRVRAWLDASGITEGAVFRGVTRHGRVTLHRLSGQDVARIVKRAALAAGLDASRFSGHSLRAGLATQAARAGKSERAIMKQTGHRSEAMVRRYIRDAELFDDNAATGIGL